MYWSLVIKHLAREVISTFFLPSSLSDGVNGGGPRDSGPPIPTDDGADDACKTLTRDAFTGDVSGVVDVFTSVSADELSLTCTKPTYTQSPLGKNLCISSASDREPGYQHQKTKHVEWRTL